MTQGPSNYLVQGTYGYLQNRQCPSPETIITIFNPSDNSKVREVEAIFDTGAVKTCLPEQDIRKLGRLHYSRVTTRGFNGNTSELRTYCINIQLGNNLFPNIEVVAISQHFGLIGRDILNTDRVMFNRYDEEWVYACPGDCPIYNEEE